MRDFVGIDSVAATIDLLMDCGSMLPEAAANHIRNKCAANDLSVTAICTMETLYAIRDDQNFMAGCVDLMCDMACMLVKYNYHGFRERAVEIMQVAERMQGGGEAVAEGDPEILSNHYVPQELHPQPEPAPAEPMPEPDPAA